MKQFILTSLLISIFSIPVFAEKMRIAVIDFRADGVTESLGRKISELIRIEMINTGKYIVTERDQMDEILKEQGFQQSGCTEVACAVEIGKILSANKMLVGTVMKIGNDIVITGRIVDVEKGIGEFSEKQTAGSEDALLNAVSMFTKSLTRKINKEYYNSCGVKFLDNGSYDRALDSFNEAIRLDPKYAKAYNNRGLVYNQKKQYERSLKDFNKAIRLDTKYAKAYNNRGLIYIQKKQYDRALKDYNKAIRLDTEYAKAYNNRGLIYGRKKQYNKALKNYHKASKLDPDNNKVYYNMACIYSLTDKKEKALLYLKMAIDSGFKYLRHMEKDTDLNNIRNTRKYGELLNELKIK